MSDTANAAESPSVDTPELKPARRVGRGVPFSLGEIRRRATHDLHIVRRTEVGQMREWLPVRSSDRALDVGCGDGYYTRQLLGECKLAAGIDVDQLTMKAGPFQGTNVTLTRAPAESLPFSNNCFDIVMGVCALEHFEDDTKALREMRRTVQPGGALVLSVDSLSIPGIPQADIDAHCERHQVRHRYTVEVLREKLAKAGFELLEHRYIITSLFAYRILRLADRLRKGLILSFPIAYPLLRMVDALNSRNARTGYILIIRAVARGG